MRFLKKSSIDRTILVISDLHLSAGSIVKGKRNPLEDFYHDKELVSFLEYYSSKSYAHHKVELIINGDFLDFLAVPFVEYFDDEFWSEKASLEKLKLIIEAHPEVIKALDEFCSKKRKRVTYIIGNHDAEFIFPLLRDHFISLLSPDARRHFNFIFDDNEYMPVEGVLIKHGHEFELSHNFDLKNSITTSAKGDRYFLPPWGSYYVTRVVNKFKQERSFINQIRPIKSFILHGLIYDTLFTLRFVFANVYYFFMVRALFILKQKKNLRKLLKLGQKEMQLFMDVEDVAQETFLKRPEVSVLIVGHTHEAAFKTYPDGSTFINTGTWTKMFNLDFSKKQEGFNLTYAQIDVLSQSEGNKDEKASSNQKRSLEKAEVALHSWTGKSDLPYDEFQ